VELRVVVGKSQTRAGRPHAVSGRPMLIHTHTHTHTQFHVHATLCRGLEKWLSERHGRGTGAAWARHGMCESNTAALSKANEKDTI
jgi:hypothetical protein